MCCRLLAEHWLVRALWQRAEGFADRSGGVPACWRPQRSLQEVCLIMENLNSMDGRGKKNLTRIVEERHCALCFAGIPSRATELCKGGGV